MGKRKLRVLFVLQNLNGGGAERVTLNLIKNLDRSIFEPVLFLLENVGIYFDDVPEDVTVEYACKNRKYNKYLMIYYLWKLYRSSKRSSVLIGALQGRPTYLAFLAGKLSHVPVVGWVHNPLDIWLKEWKKWHSTMTRYIYPRLRYTVCVSKHSQKSLESCTNISPKRISTIYNANDIDSITRRANEKCDASLVNIFEKLTIISVGRITYQKGYDLLIKAHAKVLKGGYDHNLLIVGSGHLEADLRRLVDKLGVNGTVFWGGYIGNPLPLIKRAAVLVVASRYEGLSGVTIEALAVGTPVVATCCGGPVEVLDNGKYGIIVDSEDVNSLAKGIIKAISDKKFRDELSLKGSERACDFKPEKIVPEWNKLLHDIM
jgi:glycosyltransferase involved in cell wall biosynthesis